MSTVNKTSVTGMQHPYQKPGFWDKNPYWETDTYTEEGKEYLRDFLKKTKENDRRRKAGKEANNRKYM